MSINKRRIYDKWILPKNNKSIHRHRMYVAFVIHFFTINDRFPTKNEYLSEIVSFLVWTKSNDKHKKTANYHQLYQPIFFEMLKIIDGVILPTKLGIALLLDTAEAYTSSIIYLLFMSSNFGSGATGSIEKYNDIFPIKELFDNLSKYKKITFKELNENFHSWVPGVDIKKIIPNSDKAPSWMYILSMLKDVGLIGIYGSEFSQLPSKSKSYDPHKYIYMKKPKNLISKKEILKIFNIDPLSVIEKIINNARTVSTKGLNKRDSTKQTAWKELLFERDGECLICGLKLKQITIASHIKDYSKSKKSEQYDVNNGITLCANHDKLFDSKLISFSRSGRLLLSDTINHVSGGLLLNTKVKFIDMSEQMEFYMKWHREKMEENHGFTNSQY